MAIVKLSATGKSVQFIDEEGNVFTTSMKYLQAYLDKEPWIKTPYLLLARLPLKVAPERFPLSYLYDPTGMGVIQEEDVDRTNDMFSRKQHKDRQAVETYKDKDVEW